jgi:probable phosphomutase (TIGR03848 family)
MLVAVFSCPSKGEIGLMSDNKPTRVLFVRHAVNDWVGKRLAGWTPGVHLNERGQQQAAFLGERLAGSKFAAIYSSPLERAQETAAAIAAHFDLTVQTVLGFGETQCGDWTGQAIEDLAKTDLWRQVQIAPSRFRFPNGESMAETQARMVAALEPLLATHAGETFVVVSHSDPLKLLTAFYLGLSLDLFQRIAISPASITEFVFSPLGAYLIRCNDTAHIPPEPEEEPKAEDRADSAAGAPGTGEASATPDSEQQVQGTIAAAGASEG